MKPLFKVCAVAKDEGPYLAEWIFHHLYFGFDLIHVYINRTSDASVRVLERISQAYPQVTFESIDWIDLCDPGVSAKLQTIAYAKELDRSRQQNVGWLLFLDVDEFWVPADFTMSVDQLVASVCSDQPAPICHLWHCELGQGAPFRLLSNGSGYELSSHLKTLFPINDIDIKHVRIHHPIFGKQVAPVDADGAPMIFDERQSELAGQSVIKPKKAYIIHRMYRSEKEYMAMMLRGRPSQKSQVKLNRPGYRSHTNVTIRRRFLWPKDKFLEYDLKKRSFLDANDIDNIVRQDKAAILKRANLAVSMLGELLESPDRSRAMAFLKGTRHEVVASDEAPAPAPAAIQPVASEGQLPPRSAPAELDRPESIQEPAQSDSTQPEQTLSEQTLSEPVRPEPIQVKREAEMLPVVETRRRRSWFAALVGRS